MAIWKVHREITKQSFIGLGVLPGLDRKGIDRILGAVVEVDFKMTHPFRANHRPSNHQALFEKLGGRPCRFEGAELQAAKFLGRALEFRMAGNNIASEKNLGYALHFIQDALCPEHIFPFRERIVWGPHWTYSFYIWLRYGPAKWSSIAREAKMIPVQSPEDLSRKVLESVDWVASLPCSYEIQGDGVFEDLRAGGPTWLGWKMSDEDTSKWIKRAAALSKGAIGLVYGPRKT